LDALGQVKLMNEHDDKNVMLYMLAGIGLGAVIGAAAGLLFAPKAGSETREELSEKFRELKGKTEEWLAEQKSKRNTKGHDALEEVGA
jgi:gas vesicle protein